MWKSRSRFDHLLTLSRSMLVFSLFILLQIFDCISGLIFNSIEFQKVHHATLNQPLNDTRRGLIAFFDDQSAAVLLTFGIPNMEWRFENVTDKLDALVYVSKPDIQNPITVKVG